MPGARPPPLHFGACPDCKRPECWFGVSGSPSIIDLRHKFQINSNYQLPESGIL